MKNQSLLDSISQSFRRRLISTFRVLFFVASLSISASVARAQSDTTKQSSDSVHNKLSLNHYAGSRSMSSLGYYAVTVDNPQLLKISAGVPIQNTLRGQVPGVLNDPYALSTYLTIRDAAASYVVDGIAYSPRIASAYNMNTFEYRTISVINSGAAGTLYGGGVNSGLMLLTSKTGENYTKPTVEFNSSTTVSLKPDDANPFTNSFDKARWRFTNAVAYMQDFGKIDLRASYSYTASPWAHGTYKETAPINTFRINTGLDLNKFKARLILDDYIVHATAQTGSPFYSYDYTSKHNTWQGNLVMSYQFLDWLKISAQGSISRYKDDDRSSEHVMLDNSNDRLTQQRYHENQQRKFVNVFLSANKKLSRGFGVTAFIGAQREKYRPANSTWSYVNAANVISTSGTSYWNDIRNNSYLAGVGLQLFNTWFVDVDYRQDHYKYVDNAKNSTTVSSAFLFGDAFHWTNKGFSFGKVRMNYSNSDFVNNTNYPYGLPSNTTQSLANLPTGGTNFEAGIDLGFLDNRVTLSVNRFENTVDHYYLLMHVIDFPQPVLIDNGKVTVKGWEASVGGVLIKKQTAQLTSKITWSKIDGSTASNVFPYIGDNSKWRGALLNQLTVKNFFVSVLIDRRTGGVTSDLTQPQGSSTDHDASTTKLRDVTVGYTMQGQGLESLKLTRATFSVSARNLMTSNSAHDAESNRTFTPIKTISINIALVF